MSANTSNGNEFPTEYESRRWRRQWVLGKDELAPILGWRSAELPCGFRLWRHPECRIAHLGTHSQGAFVVGTAVHPNGRLGEFEHTLRRSENSQKLDLIKTVEYLGSLSGTYAFVAYDQDGPKIFTDPAAMCGVYYTTAGSAVRAASTPALLGPTEIDERRLGSFRLSDSDAWMTGSQTPFKGIQSLLANHVLTLSTGIARRFWPTSPHKPRTFHEAVQEGAESVLHLLRQLADDRTPLYSITGGYDSRINLAAASVFGENIKSFTLDVPSMRESERRIVRRLVEACGPIIEHGFIPVPEPPQWLLSIYDEMTHGMSLGSRRTVCGAVAGFANDSVIHVNGNLGALAKGFYWDRIPPSHFDPRRVLRDFRNRSRCIRDGIDEWASSVPSFLTPAVAYNLLYLEQRGGRWMGVGETASQLFYDSYTPFCSRNMFEIICSCPATHQADGTFLAALVEHLNPNLAGLPYHSGTSHMKRLMPKRLKRIAARLLSR